MCDTPQTSRSDKSRDLKRYIRSFVIRSGRMTDSQREALEKHLQQWSLCTSQSADQVAEPYQFDAIYGNSRPVCLEIGFGMGDSLHQMAKADLDTNFLGVEVHTPGVGRLLRLVEESALSNVRVVADDAVKILKENIPPGTLDRVNIFFPDPWHKRKHHKRRLIQNDFLTLLHSRLRTGGTLHIATDWAEYADHVLRCVTQSKLFAEGTKNGPYVKAADYGRPETKFERRGIRLKHEIADLVFTSVSKPDC